MVDCPPHLVPIHLMPVHSLTEGMVQAELTDNPNSGWLRVKEPYVHYLIAWCELAPCVTPATLVSNIGSKYRRTRVTEYFYSPDITKLQTMQAHHVVMAMAVTPAKILVTTNYIDSMRDYQPVVELYPQAWENMVKVLRSEYLATGGRDA